jgi:L-rhamnose isomerase / sugar isomerase
MRKSITKALTFSTTTSMTDSKAIEERVNKFKVEVPSWGFCRGGTRFGTYSDGSEAVSIEEKLSDVALVHRLTGATPSVALHFPWDGATKKGYAVVAATLKKSGIAAGAINSNLFGMRNRGPLDYRIRLGSITSPYADIRNASVQHHSDCIGIMRQLGSKILSIWLPDGSNSPGQISFFDQSERLLKALQDIYRGLRDDEWMFLEYKLFEPGFYSTAVADWGKAFSLCQAVGPRAKVLVDLGHHPLGTNIEQIVSDLARLGRLGGFHFNDKKYGDDDLAAGSIDPFQLFRIFATLVEADRRKVLKFDDIAFLIDQSHMIKNPVEEILETIENLQRAYVQALSIDWGRLDKAREDGDITVADGCMKRAFTDTPATAILQRSRSSIGKPINPIEEFRQLQRHHRVRGIKPKALRASVGLGS